MALINCSECNHLMSETAAICPNCNNPRNASAKKCIHCGEPMELRKRKCQSCNNFQTSNITNSSMANSKSNSTNLFLPFILFLVGAAAMYFIQPLFAAPPTETIVTFEKEDATVNKINGLYVYIEASPKNKDNYQVIGNVEGDNIFEMVNSIGIGEEKTGKVLENIFNLGKDNINFHEQLLKITEKVKEQFPNAEGVIFSNKIRKCEVVVFTN